MKNLLHFSSERFRAQGARGLQPPRVHGSPEGLRAHPGLHGLLHDPRQGKPKPRRQVVSGSSFFTTVPSTTENLTLAGHAAKREKQ